MQSTQQNEANAEIEEEHVVFTFFMGDTEFAVPLEEILAVNPMPEGSVQMPVGDESSVRVIEYQGEPTELIDFASLLGVRSMSEIKLETAGQLDLREQEHVEWINALKRAVREDEPFEKATNPHMCAFGKWYDSYTTRDERLQEILAKFDEPHKRIHALAETLLDLNRNGQKQEALAQLEIESATTLMRMCQLFESARYQLRRMARRVVLFLTIDGESPALSLAIDEVSDVRRFHQSQLQSIEKSGTSLYGKTGDRFRGIFMSEEGSAIVLLNTSALI